MGLIDKIRGNALPAPEKVTTHTQVAALVRTIESSHSKQLRAALEEHPVLHNAWETLSASAHPDHAPISDEINPSDGRHVMVRDLIAVLNGEKLPPALDAA